MRFCFSKADDKASRPVGRNLDSACRAKVGLHKASPAKGVSRHSSPWQEGFLAAPKSWKIWSMCPDLPSDFVFPHCSLGAVHLPRGQCVSMEFLWFWGVLGTQNLKYIIYTFLEMSCDGLFSRYDFA